MTFATRFVTDAVDDVLKSYDHLLAEYFATGARAALMESTEILMAHGQEEAAELLISERDRLVAAASAWLESQRAVDTMKSTKVG